MKTRIHIERLVVEGVPVGAGGNGALKEALQQELTEQLGVSGVAGELRRGVAIPRLPAGVMPFAARDGAAELGRGIARVVHGSLQRQGKGSRR